MDIILKDGSCCFDLAYPLSHDTKWIRGKDELNPYAHIHSHESIAEIIAKNGYKTYMVAVVCDRLATDHWDDPIYMHKTNHIIVSKAKEEARRALMNKYFSPEEIAHLIEKYEMPTLEFNFKADEDRGFKFKLEDSFFEYQEEREIISIMESVLDGSKYKVDDEGYPIEDDEGNFILEDDPEKVDKQKEKLLEEWLIPRVQTTYDRVYNMPAPFSWWDYRSAFHQGFFVEVDTEGVTYVDMGGSGSSGRRESNGRWAHTFGLLAHKYKIETPSFFMRYDKNNVFREDFRLDTFAVIGRDLSGNYSSSQEIMRPLFKGRVYNIEARKETFEYDYVKREDLYY